MQLQTVHVRINDAATGQPTPVRLRVTDAAGNYFAPFGHAAEFPTGRNEAVCGDVILDGRRWAVIDGSCEIAVPPGDLVVEVQKGPEYRPLRKSLHLPAGKMALRLAIERCADHRAIGWLSGDPRVHALSPHGALLAAAAEDLDVVHLLAAATATPAADGHTYITYPNLEAFSGQYAALERHGRLVVVGTLNEHPVLGSLALLHCHRVVYPLNFGGADATDDWSLGDWCDQCHRKRGLVIWTGAGTTPIGRAAEALAHAVLGHVDAVEVTPDQPDSLTLWQQLLAAGVRIPIVGASGKRSNAVAMGAGRTYTRIDPALPDRLQAWIEALRAGKTCASFGAGIHLTVNGCEPGDTLQLSEPTTLRPLVQTMAAEPTKTEIVWNGQALAGDAPVLIESSGWLTARAWNVERTRLLSHTSPVWVELPGVPQPRHAGAIAALRRHLEAGRDWVERHGRFEKERIRRQLMETFEAAIGSLTLAHP